MLAIYAIFKEMVTQKYILSCEKNKKLFGHWPVLKVGRRGGDNFRIRIVILASVA
jgi:hypothetical protein